MRCNSEAANVDCTADHHSVGHLSRRHAALLVVCEAMSCAALHLRSARALVAGSVPGQHEPTTSIDGVMGMKSIRIQPQRLQKMPPLARLQHAMEVFRRWERRRQRKVPGGQNLFSDGRFVDRRGSFGSLNMIWIRSERK
jgi:hypothetical protein